jgi:hypothetical protein
MSMRFILIFLKQIFSLFLTSNQERCEKSILKEYVICKKFDIKFAHKLFPTKTLLHESVRNDVKTKRYWQKLWSSFSMVKINAGFEKECQLNNEDLLNSHHNQDSLETRV